jgi:hypothetical protein
MTLAVSGAALLAGAAVPVAANAAGAAPTAMPRKASKPKKKAFTAVQAGIRLSTVGLRYEDTYRVKRSPFGEGSVIRDAVLTRTTFPATGSDTAKTYDRGGRTFAKETFTLGTPNVDGVGAISGNGTCESGTGTHFGETCTYSFKGHYDLITGFTQITLTGTYTLGAKHKPTK